MRYFRSEALPLTRKQAQKALYATLTKEERSVYRKARRLCRLQTLLFWTVSGACFSLFVFLFSFFPESSTASFLSFLEGLLRAVFFPAALIVSLLLGLVACLPLLAKNQKSDYKNAQRLLRLACKPLREAYGVKKPLLVTKCYDCSNGDFRNKDVLLFFCEGELRITANLKCGFYEKEKDLGCFALSPEEITLREEQRENLHVCILESEGLWLVLGRRAKHFLDEHLSGKEAL